MNDQLRTDLASGADTFDLPPGDLGTVVQRGRRRSRRRHQLTASLAAVAVVATTVAAVRAANPDAPTTKFATQDDAAHLGDSGIEWAAAGAPETAISAWSYRGTAELDGRTYSLSTAPGKHETDQALPPVLWRSDDGVEWSQAPTPTSFFPSRLAAGDGRLYAIGTGPATSATGASVHVGWSDGGDGAWQDRTLPIDTAGWARKVTDVFVLPVDVAAGHDAAVAVAGVSVDLDVPALLPAGETAPHGWYVADDGIDVLGAGPECPAGTSPENPDPTARAKMAQATGSKDTTVVAADGKATAANDGTTVSPRRTAVPDRTVDAPTGRQYDSWCWSADGTGQSYAPTAGRGVTAHHTWAELGIAGDLLRAVQGQPFVFRGDGSGRFERADVPELAGRAEVEATADGFVLAATGTPTKGVDPKGGTADGEGRAPALLRSVDGRTWQSGGNLPKVDDVLALGTVDGHLALVGSGPDGGTYAELGSAGWRTTSLNTLIDSPKGGWIGAAAIGPLGVVASLGQSKGDVSSTSIVASRDGRTWSRTPLDDLIGGPGDVARIVIKDDRAVVTAVAYADGQKARQVAVVGTPR
jgi:hypothetical protein